MTFSSKTLHVVKKSEKNYNDLRIDWGNISFRVRANNILYRVIKKNWMLQQKHLLNNFGLFHTHTYTKYVIVDLVIRNLN